MIFKVLYQETLTEAPVREHTKSVYVEADSIRDVREKLADRNYNIEHIIEVSGEFLEYEKQGGNYKVENV
jgi:DNA-dependent RNA polymerase auxiliary subunit epsilon